MIEASEIRVAADLAEAARFAGEEAQRFEHSEIDSVHLILGIARQNFSYGRLLLDMAGATLEKLRHVAEELIPSTNHRGSREWNPSAKEILDSARREALRRDHPECGTAHLLCALCLSTTSPAYQLLTEANVDFGSLGLRADQCLRPQPIVDMDQFYLELRALQIAVGDYQFLRSPNSTINAATRKLMLTRRFLKPLKWALGRKRSSTNYTPLAHCSGFFLPYFQVVLQFR